MSLESYESLVLIGNNGWYLKIQTFSTPFGNPNDKTYHPKNLECILGVNTEGIFRVSNPFLLVPKTNLSSIWPLTILPSTMISLD
ncbi:hypothetical protein CEXT_541791 [Caerostris extrusa]|uniref:Uncharacterized protein n=1 Tax=Caerostris extrusa TaxID=172846 RepID=A0AAV4XA90_CAEEX|nr:hypothetical protein CEXT_541791 [Caerostris extrusa]